MRSASSILLKSLGLLAFSAGSLMAAPTISSWSAVSDGQKETIELRWTEAGPVEMHEFNRQRQVVAVFPGASLKGDSPVLIDTSALPMLTRARLQPVTLPSGEQGVQLTLQLSEWATAEPTTTGDAFLLSIRVPDNMRPVVADPSVDTGGLVFTDEMVERMNERGFGAVDAPRTGAGQSTSANPISAYFVPPQVVADDSVTETQTLDDIAVQTKLNEVVRRVDFQGTSLENVLRLISEEAELNIMLAPSEVAGRTVTLRLRNVTLRQMLDALLKSHNLGYTIEDGGIVRVVPRDQVKSTIRETVTVPIPINWVDAADVAAALQPFVNEEEDGLLEVSTASNTLIVRDVPETVKAIQSLIQSIDVPEKQVLVELRLVNMSETARRAFGMRTGLESQATESRFLRPGGDFFDLNNYANSNTSLTSGTNTTFENTVDSSLSSVVGNTGGSFTSTSNSTLTDELSSNASSTVDSAFSAVPSSRAGLGLLAPNASALQLSQLFTAEVFGSTYDVDLALNAQEDRGEAVTLANPTVLSLNNQEATVEIKRRLPFVSALNSDQGSVATVEFLDVGTEVVLLPRITNNGYIMMEISPEQIIDTGLRVNGTPVTDERRVTASVIVRDEQTIALGGLREFIATSSESGIPYLLRLPVLSWLFKNQENRQDKTELYLFVHPEIVKDPTPTAYQQSLFEKIDYNWDLPDYYFDEVYARSAPVGGSTRP